MGPCTIPTPAAGTPRRLEVPPRLRQVPEPDEERATTILTLLRSEDPQLRQQAWERFLSEYSPLLLRVAFRFSADYDGSMDRYAFMLDEFSRNGHRRLRAFEDGSARRFAPWLVVVTRRMCVDHHRRKYGRHAERSGSLADQRRRMRRTLHDLRHALTEAESLPAPETINPECSFPDADRWQEVAQALETLSSEDRRLLRLKYGDGLTARQIATTMNLRTPFHVYRRLGAVCAALRRHIARQRVEVGR